MSRDIKNKHTLFQNSTFFAVNQDTIPATVQQDSTDITVSQDTVLTNSPARPEDSVNVESILLLFEQSNRHQKTIDSLTRPVGRPSSAASASEDPGMIFSFDSSHIIFSVDSSASVSLPDFELDLPKYSYKSQENEGSVFIEGGDDHSVQSATDHKVTVSAKGSGPSLMEKEKFLGPDDWILGIILASFVVLAWIRLFYNKFLSPTIVAVINQQVSHNLFRDKSGVSMRVASGLNLIFYLNGGLFLYLLVKQLGTNLLGLDRFWMFLVLCLILMGVYSVKQFITFLVGTISLSRKLFTEYMHNVFLFNKNIGLFLFPVILGMVYMPDFLYSLFFYLGLFILSSAYLLRLIRGFQIFIKEGVSILYWILYLCALEILPILLFLKLSGLLVW